MPDEWGRPTFNDFANIGMGLMSVQQGMRRQQEFDEEREIAALASRMNDPDFKTDGISPDKLWKAKVLNTKQSIDEYQLKNEARQDKFNEIKARRDDFADKWATNVAVHRGVDDKAYVDNAIKLFNGLNNGITVSDTKDGKVEITYPDTTKSLREKYTPEEVGNMYLNYMNPEAGPKMDLAWKKMIQEDNYKSMSGAVPLFGKDSRPTGFRTATVYDDKLNRHYKAYWREDGTPATTDDLKMLKKMGAMTAEDMKDLLSIMTERERLSAARKINASAGKDGKQENAAEPTDIDKIYKGIKDYFEVIPGGVKESGELVKVDRNTATAIREYARKHGGDARFRTFKDGTFAFEKVIPFRSDENVTVVKQGGAGLMSGDSPAGNGTVVQPRLPGESIEKWAERTGGLSGKPEKPGAQSKQPKGVSGKPINSSKKRNYASQYLNSGKEGKDYLKKTITDMHGPQGWEAVLQEAEALKKEREKIKKDTGKITWNTLFGEREINLPVQGKYK